MIIANKYTGQTPDWNVFGCSRREDRHMMSYEAEAQCQQEQQEEYEGLQAIFGEQSCTCDSLTGELKARSWDLAA